MPHPTFGYMALQPRASGGFVFWTCQNTHYAGSSADGGCYADVNDCSVLANWSAVIIDTGAPALFPDIVVSQQNFNPTTNVNDYTTGVYVSFFDTGTSQWSVASCHGVPDLIQGWSCSHQGLSVGTGKYVARGWSFAPVMPGSSPHAISSTIRVVNGDVVATFLEDNRLQIATCPGGVNCHRSAGWHPFTLNGSLADDTSAAFNGQPAGFGTITTGLNGDMVVGYPNVAGGTRSVNFLVGGRFGAQ
jgi:hypothetical protein